MTYLKGCVLQHKRSKRLYIILVEPSDAIRLEATNEPCYMYCEYPQALTGPFTTWIRSKNLMEDGRFEVVQVH